MEGIGVGTGSGSRNDCFLIFFYRRFIKHAHTCTNSHTHTHTLKTSFFSTLQIFFFFFSSDPIEKKTKVNPFFRMAVKKRWINSDKIKRKTNNCFFSRPKWWKKNNFVFVFSFLNQSIRGEKSTKTWLNPYSHLDYLYIILYINSIDTSSSVTLQK